MPSLQFSAEVIEVKVKKAPSLDKVISIRLETSEEQALLLQDYIAQDVITVEVKND